MRVDECEVGGHLPSHQDWLRGKNTRNPERRGVRRVAAAVASRRPSPRRPRLLLPEAGGCAHGDRPRPRPSARRAAGTIWPDPPGPGVRARGALRLRSGGGGPRGNRGARGQGPPGERPLPAVDPARRPGSASEGRERRRSGTLLFCRPRIVGSSGQPGHICRRRRHRRAGLGPPKSPRGGGPGGPSGGRGPAAGHFLRPAALPRAPLPPRPPPPGARPARLPRPGRTFRVGRTEKKKFRRRGGEGAPRAAGTRPGRRGRPFPLVPRSPAGPARPGGGAFLSLPALFPAPGASWAEARGSRARPGLSPAGGPAAWRTVARDPRRRRLGAGRPRGPGSPAQPPRVVARRARVHRSPPPRTVAGPGVRVREGGDLTAAPRGAPGRFPGGGPSSSWLRGPRARRRGEEGRCPWKPCLRRVLRGGRRRWPTASCPARSPHPGQTDLSGSPPTAPHFSLKMEDRVKFLESQM